MLGTCVCRMESLHLISHLRLEIVCVIMDFISRARHTKERNGRGPDIKLPYLSIYCLQFLGTHVLLGRTQMLLLRTNFGNASTNRKIFRVLRHLLLISLLFLVNRIVVPLHLMLNPLVNQANDRLWLRKSPRSQRLLRRVPRVVLRRLRYHFLVPDRLLLLFLLCLLSLQAPPNRMYPWQRQVQQSKAQMIH